MLITASLPAWLRYVGDCCCCLSVVWNGCAVAVASAEAINFNDIETFRSVSIRQVRVVLFKLTSPSSLSLSHFVVAKSIFPFWYAVFSFFCKQFPPVSVSLNVRIISTLLSLFWRQSFLHWHLLSNFGWKKASLFNLFVWNSQQIAVIFFYKIFSFSS